MVPGAIVDHLGGPYALDAYHGIPLAHEDVTGDCDGAIGRDSVVLLLALSLGMNRCDRDRDCGESEREARRVAARVLRTSRWVWGVRPEAGKKRAVVARGRN
jgi:hypothetical protein